MSLRQTTYLLWLLAVTVLLVQSLAVWHDAEHAFHDHGTLCDQLNVVSHTPSIDSSNQLSVHISQQRFQRNVSVATSSHSDTDYPSFVIRAPPSSS